MVLYLTYDFPLRPSEPQIFSDTARHFLKGEGLVYGIKLRDALYAAAREQKRLIEIDEIPAPEGPEELTPWRSQPPGYPIFLAFTFKLFNTVKTGPARVIQIFLDSLVCFFIFGIASMIFNNRRIALGASWFYALWLPSVILAARVGYYWATAFVIMGSLYLFLRGMKNDSWACYLGSAAIITLGVLNRQEPVFFPLLFGFGLFLNKGLKKALPVSGVMMAVVFLIGLLPWAWRNHQVTGRWFFMVQEKWEHIYDTLHFFDPQGRWNLPEVNEALREEEKEFALATPERDQFFKEKSLAVIKSDPLGFVRHVLLKQIIRFTVYPESLLSHYGGEPWLADYLKAGGTPAGYLLNHPWPFFARFAGKAMESAAFFLALAGIWLYRRAWRMTYFLWIVPLYFFAGYLPMLALPLYLIPPKSLFLILSAAGIFGALEWRKARGQIGGSHA